MDTLMNFFIVIAGVGLVSAQVGPLVDTSLGKIRGATMRTEHGMEFNAFRGIRYAVPPVGKLRFAPPVAVSNWTGILDATQDGYMCPQVGKKVELYSEDCLVLNVYTKSLVGNKSVIFYMHGGANIYGGSHSLIKAGPEFLMESDIVLVTLNFRLGAFGHLSTRSKEAPGNYAYLDQLMALQWVRDHISNFGGNPRSVTIMGVSAGGHAVTLHMVSPLSQGLFHRAIPMSGSVTNEYVIDNLRYTRRLAHETSCPKFNPKDLVDCLRKLPWEKIVDVVESWLAYNLIDIKWSYEIDGHFITKHPSLSFAEGNFSRVPTMAGITKDEFTFLFLRNENNTGLINDVSLNFDKYATDFFLHNFSDPKVNKAERLRSFYLGNKSIAEQNLTNFGVIFSDALINHSVHRLVELARKYVDVFYYRFDYQGSMSIFLNWEGKPRGVCHGDDIQYFFKRTKWLRHLNSLDPEWFMVERMVGIVSSFAKNGSSQTIGGVNWVPCDKRSVRTLYIDSKVTMGNEPYAERFKLWDELFPMGRGGSGVRSSAGLMVVLVLVWNLVKFIV